MTSAFTGLQLRSLIKPSGELELSLVSVDTPEPAADEVVVRVQATPLNPSDIGLLFGAADLSTASLLGSGTQSVMTMKIPQANMKSMAARSNQSMPVGNEGAGVVVAAGKAPLAQALLGKTVAILAGAMYSQYRTVKADSCLVLPSGASAADGASCYVNPLTALGFVETMRHEGHKAIVHTAAASNLGQILNKICIKDGIGLVNIVRSPAQAAILKNLGASYVVDSSAATFLDDMTAAVVATGATLAFDATGGGKLAGQILTCMEEALNKTAKEYSRYGSVTHKQVYLYGGLDTSPTTFNRSFGMSWGMGGWLVFPYFQKLGSAKLLEMKGRVVAELKTTFASHYAKEISLVEVLSLEAIAAYGARTTGTKYLVNPSL